MIEFYFTGGQLSWPAVSVAQSMCSGQKSTIYPLTFATKPTENKQLSLNCLLSDGDHNATFEWFLNGQKVVSSIPYRATSSNNVLVKQDEDRLMLNIRQMHLYEFRTSNRVGHDSQNF